MKRIKLDPATEEAIFKAPESDPYQLSLILKDLPAKDRIFIATQVEARQKAKVKIPEFYDQRRILFPSIQAVEQASSSAAAKYKARLVEGGTLTDLTGGLGVDAFFFAGKTEKVIYLEKEGKIADYAEHNFQVLEVRNIQVIHSDALEYLRHSGIITDYCYVDPSRRTVNRRVFRIEESDPDIGTLYEELLEYSGRMIVKLSPLIDIKYLLQHFQFIREIHILAIGQECREVILVLDRKDFSKDPPVITCSLEREREQIFMTSWERNKPSCPFDHPRQYIYDPNVAIRKSGLYNELGLHFNLKKLAPNSHLFTGNQSLDTFPGRIFQLSGILNMKEFLKESDITRANIATRNFPLRVNEIREKTGIRDGGDLYIFCTADLNDHPVVLLTHKVDYLNKK